MKLYRLDGFNLREELSDIVVIKRDGKRVKFDSTKIAVAIKKDLKLSILNIHLVILIRFFMMLLMLLKMVIMIKLRLNKFKILLKK